MANMNASMSKGDWVAYMKDTHGLDMSGSTKDEIISKAEELDGISYTNTRKPAAKEVVSAAHGKQRKQKKVKIRIPSTEAVGGKDDVYINVNGVGYIIQRDQDVEVPESVYCALDDAQQTIYKQDKDGALVPRKVHRYPFSLVA